MSQNFLSPHDPKFTAYALGELEPEERAAVEAALRDNPAARAAVDEIRATAAHLSAALAAEPLTETGAEASIAATAAAAVKAGRTGPAINGHLPAYDQKKFIKFPQFYYIAGLAAAACFALFVALREPAYHPPGRISAKQQEKSYITIQLPPSSADGAAGPAMQGAETTAANAPLTVATAGPVKSDQRLADAAPATSKASSLLEQVNDERAAAAPAGDIRVAAGSNPVPVPTLSGRGFSTSAGVPLPPGVALSGYEVFIDKDSVSRMRPIPAGTGAAGPEADAKSPGVASATAADVAGRGPAAPPAPLDASQNREVGYASTTAPTSTRLGMLPGAPETRRSTQQSRNIGSDFNTTENDFLSVEKNPSSTFAINVDTASYPNIRRFIESGLLPPVDAVRIEEMLNYFPYAYSEPKEDEPFGATLEVASAPWAPTHRLLQIKLKAREVPAKARPAANLVFLLDVSSSMNAPNRLPLVKESMRLLVAKLRPDDRVAIVTYAGPSGLVLPSTPVSRSHEILEALDTLAPGSSTPEAIGIQLAYDIAKSNFVNGGFNRVILCTDGDFNVGVSNEGDLTRLIGEKAKSGMLLTTLGFGMGKQKDPILEKLAAKGNGDSGYVETRREAEKLLLKQVNDSVETAAKDVKIQVAFNAEKVASYRLIGYESRLSKQEESANAEVEAGDIDAGHTVTALYEIVPVGALEKSGDSSRPPTRARVATAQAKGKTSADNELLTVKIAYKKPGGFLPRKLEFPLIDRGRQFAEASDDFKLAAAVASFGMILRDSPHRGNATLSDILAWAAHEDRDDAVSRRREFINLVNAARRLMQ